LDSTALSHLSYIGICHTTQNIDILTNKIILKCPLLTHLNLEGNDELHHRGLRNIRFCILWRTWLMAVKAWAPCGDCNNNNNNNNNNKIILIVILIKITTDFIFITVFPEIF
jgi:hypothetical protein